MARSVVEGSEYGVSSSLEVRESEQYGRGLYSRTAISPGVEMMRAEPFVHVLNNDFRGKLCDYCLLESKLVHKLFVSYYITIVSKPQIAVKM